MKKFILLCSAVMTLVLAGCVTYVTPGRYNESTPFTNDYTILGYFSVDLPVEQKANEAKGIKEVAIEAAKAQYAEADDIIDVTIMTKMKTTIIIVPIYDWEVTLEGYAIRYN